MVPFVPSLGIFFSAAGRLFPSFVMERISWIRWNPYKILRLLSYLICFRKKLVVWPRCPFSAQLKRNSEYILTSPSDRRVIAMRGVSDNEKNFSNKLLNK